jgi:phosphoglucomutase/phosphomannomutase
LVGLSSIDLARVAARTYAAHGFEIVAPEPDVEWWSTPMLSFAVRHLGCSAGLMVSASHNAPDDNGLKVYDSHGAQLVHPQDQSLLQTISRERVVPSASLRWAHPPLREAWVDAVCAGWPQSGMRVLVTPLHGTVDLVSPLARLGCDVVPHGPQASPDGRFPTVPGHQANPERPEVFAHALAHAEGFELVLASDPDGDRIGCAVFHDGSWQVLDGQDVALLVVDAALSRPYPATPLVMTTEVTTQLIQRLAAARGARVVADLPVGFKHIGAGLHQLEATGHWRGITSGDVCFAAGVEESGGALCTADVRDKDAASGAVALVCAAWSSKARGLTLVDRLWELRRTLGHVHNHTVRLSGATCPPPGLFAAGHRLDGRPVLACDQGDGLTRIQVGSLAADEGARVLIRASGTEALVKVYAEVWGRPGLSLAADTTVRASVKALAEATAWRLGG